MSLLVARTCYCVRAKFTAFSSFMTGLRVTNNENALDVARTGGDFVDLICHAQQVRSCPMGLRLRAN